MSAATIKKQVGAVHEHDSEPVWGLPEALPDGELMLWQGAPNWRLLARRALHVRGLAVYFGIFILWRAVSALTAGESPLDIALPIAGMILLACTALALLGLFAWLVGRTTVYTITSRRVVIRFGIALPMTINLPFRVIESAAVKTRGDGSGDVPLALTRDARLAYLLLWPHARPWRLTSPQPMLRALPEASHVAKVLAHALDISCERHMGAEAGATVKVSRRAVEAA